MATFQERKCKICLKMFVPKVGNQTTCSRDCKRINRQGGYSQHKKAADDPLSGKIEPIRCRCPLCKQYHTMNIWWIGDGIPWKYCQNCSEAIQHVEPVINKESRCGGGYCGYRLP